MAIRILLQPWWVRALYGSVWSVTFGFASIALIRYQHNGNPNPFSLPLPGIAVIVLGCVCLAGLLEAVGQQRRSRYLDVLQAISTPAERSQVLAAVSRGPAPDNPHIRHVAGQLAWLQLSAYRKNRTVMWIVYPLATLTWLFGAAVDWSEHDHHRAIGSVIFAGIFVVLFAWMLLIRRRWAARVAVLAPALLDPLALP